jgi:16S rRNA C967 or C1407 C5-methylase (RsmB/RsmF family)
MGSLAQKIEAAYAPSALRDELIREAKKIEEERDTFLAILSLQQTVNELRERIDAVDPETSLEQRIQDVLDRMRAASGYDPACGFDDGWVSGMQEAISMVQDAVSNTIPDE